MGVAMKPVLVGILAGAVLAGGRAGAQSPDIDELIPRATAYAHDFVEKLSNVVAEERYEQEMTSPRRKRVLVSDFLLVKYPGDALWQTFRAARVDVDRRRDRSCRQDRIAARR
jgi:SHS2 domain-containing protein